MTYYRYRTLCNIVPFQGPVSLGLELNVMGRLFDGLELPASADFHVHLREGQMMAAATPTILQGGVDTAFVMVQCKHIQ